MVTRNFDAGNNFSRGTNDADVINGGPGNDFLIGGALNDRLFSPEDMGDTLIGAEGNDELRGGPGDDLIYGNINNDPDDSEGPDNRDQIKGGAGDDTIKILVFSVHRTFQMDGSYAVNNNTTGSEGELTVTFIKVAARPLWSI